MLCLIFINMNLKRIIKEEIDDSLDWIKSTPEVSIGGKNDLPIESVPLGTKIVTPDGDVFTIEDVTGFHMPHQFVWGSDLETPWLGPKNDDDNKNWHNALWLRRATPRDLNESNDLDWIQDSQPTKKDIISFNKTKYETTLDYDDIEIGDKFIPPGSQHIWTVDDMYEWGVSSRYYRFMVWLKNDKGSIRRKIYNRGNKFPGDYRPWRKIVGSNVNESEELDWIKDINPELSNENFHLFYNKPFYWYHQGKPVSPFGVPRVFWFEESGIHVRDEDDIALMCYKDVNSSVFTSEPKDECTDIFHSTAIRYIKKGTLQHQPQLSDIKECEHYLDKIVNNVTLINEDGRKPDMEWDFTKNNLDKSKKWVKTKEDVKKYLSLLFNKLKNLPRKIKVKIIKYVLASFIGLLTVNQLQTVVDEVSPEKIEITKIQQPEKEESKVESIRKPSEELFTFLKKEEGYVGKGYKIGDGKITIGWGHAEDINNSKYKLGQEIDTIEAETLLKQDVKQASESLNRILNDWESKGIKVNVTQDMYNTMTSMIFNMGIGNFRKSDFIQLVKKNKLDKAKEEIKTTSSHLFSKFPGLKKRREKESNTFKVLS